MMDYYNVDTSAFTNPPIVMHISQARYWESSATEALNFWPPVVSGESESAWVVASFESREVREVNDSARHAPLTIRPIVKVSVSPASEKTNFDALKAKLEFVYCNDEAATIDDAQSRIALRGVVDVVEDLVDERDYSALDSLLSTVDPQRLRAVTAVAFLRSSFTVKDKLLSWNGLYQVVYAHLSNTGQNPKRALRGLSSNPNQSFA